MVNFFCIASASGRVDAILEVEKSFDLFAKFGILLLLFGCQRIQPRRRWAAAVVKGKPVRAAGGGLRVGEKLIREQRYVDAGVPNGDQDRSQLLVFREGDFAGRPDIGFDDVVERDVLLQDFAASRAQRDGETDRFRVEIRSHASGLSSAPDFWTAGSSSVFTWPIAADLV